MVPVEDLLSRWEEATAKGSRITVEELCADCPELIGELTARIQARQEEFDRSATHPSADPQGTVAQTQLVKTASPGGNVGFDLTFGELRFHARGGLGEVYVAVDRQLTREVALKFIHERYAKEGETQERFLREAEVTGRLDHPGVVPVHGYGRAADGRPFYAMRFIQGETLDAAIHRFHTETRSPAQRRLEFRDLLTRFISVCNTIAYAHNRGIVHRDVKPENIMLGKYRETLVVDWGLAMPVGRDQQAKASGEKTLLPRSGSHSSDSAGGGGTPAYMSPEQADSNPEIGPAADIYSLGTTFYKLLTGDTPFKGTNVREVLDNVRKGQFRRPRAVRPDIHPLLEAVCLKAMALQPNDAMLPRWIWPGTSSTGWQTNRWPPTRSHGTSGSHAGPASIAPWCRRAWRHSWPFCS